MSKSRRPRKRKTSPLLIDTLAPSLFERSAAYLRRGLPPDTTEFDRISFQAMANFVWAHCPDVESVPDRCSGQWVVKGTRVLVQGILDNAEDFTAEQIATEIYDLDVEPDGSEDYERPCSWPAMWGMSARFISGTMPCITAWRGSFSRLLRRAFPPAGPY